MISRSTLDRDNSHRGARVLVAAIALATLATACSSSGTSTTASQGSSAADDAALGTPKAATGTPVTIGFVSPGSDAIATQTDLAEKGAAIAVKYVNDYLGGIDGHPIELFTCRTKETPAGAQDCANQMVQKKVPAVLLPFSGQGSSLVPIITAAGIPYVGMQGASSEELTTPGAFAMSGGFPAQLAAIAKHAKAQGYKKVAFIVIDVPAATQGVQALGGLAFGNASVAIDTRPVPPGTPDMTPALQAAVDGGADALAVVGDISFCTSFLQGYDTLALKTPKYITPTCVEQSVANAVPDAFEGAFDPTGYGTDADNDVYAAMLEKYAPGDAISPNPELSSGVAVSVLTIVSFVKAMNGVAGIDAPSMLAQMRTATNVPLFLSGGVTFTCNGKSIPLLANVCSSGMQMAVLNGDGTSKSRVAIDGSDLFVTK